MAGGQEFAFALFDATDNVTVAKTRLAYRLFRDLGIKSTKAAWPVKIREVSRTRPSMCFVRRSVTIR